MERNENTSHRYNKYTKVRILVIRSYHDSGKVCGTDMIALAMPKGPIFFAVGGKEEKHCTNI